MNKLNIQTRFPDVENERLQTSINWETSNYNKNEKLYNELGGWGSDDEDLNQKQLDLKDEYLTNMLESNYYIKKLTEKKVKNNERNKEI